MKKLTLDEFILKAKEKHSNKYIYNKVIYINAKEKVEIICTIHGSFWQIPNDHLSGSACRKCGMVGKVVDTDSFIKKSKEIFGNLYNYSKSIYINKKIKIKIKCKIHDIFEKLPKSHILGEGCPKCSNIGKSLSIQEFINKSNLIHSNYYKYDKSIYINNYTQIIITCPKHGEFKQIPTNHLQGSSCYDCFLDKKRLNLENFISKCNIIHFGKYDYSKINFEYYTNNKSKTVIVCPKHGDFKQSFFNHSIMGNGCRKCSKTVSKLEICWLKSLNINDLQNQVPLSLDDRKIIVDGFSKINNTIYEFYGDYWHGNPKIYNSEDLNKCNKKLFGDLYKFTIERENLIKNAGYNLITIWESDFKKINK